jgi:hypothetical protein
MKIFGSPSLVKELENLRWEEDKPDLHIEQKPIWGKQPKHAIDALSYIIAPINKPKEYKLMPSPWTRHAFPGNVWLGGSLSEFEDLSEELVISLLVDGNQLLHVFGAFRMPDLLNMVYSALVEALHQPFPGFAEIVNLFFHLLTHHGHNRITDRVY